MKNKRRQPRSKDAVPTPEPDAASIAAQLENALAVARAAYTLTVQIVAVAAAAIAALLAIAVEFDSYASVAIGGIALLLLFVQVRAAGKAIAGIILAARRLEIKLNIDAFHSAVSPIYAAVAGRKRYALLEEAAHQPASPSTDLVSLSATLAPFRGGITTTVAIIASVFLLALGLALAIANTPWIAGVIAQAFR